jgi:hypothetical protein
MCWDMSFVSRCSSLFLNTEPSIKSSLGEHWVTYS